MNVSGMVLAGGLSQRMGSPKALLNFRGKLLIQHALERLRPVCSEVFIVTKTPGPYQRFGADILTDLYEGAGPMGGIYTGLQYASNRFSLVLACDMPFVRRELLLGLIRRAVIEPSLRAAVPLAPRCGGAGHPEPGEEPILQPLCALYSKDCLPFFHQEIESNKISLYRSLNRPGIEIVPWLELDPEDRDSTSFANINTREELQRHAIH